MNTNHEVVCAGAMLWDALGHTRRRLAFGDDHTGEVSQHPGGVALNVARNLRRLGCTPVILSAIGTDSAGDLLASEVADMGISIAYLCRLGISTGRYIAIEDADGLVAAIADTRCLDAAGKQILAPLLNGALKGSRTVLLDGNLAPAVLNEAAEALSFCDLRIIPASPSKAGRLTPFLRCPNAALYLNLHEAEALLGHHCPDAAHAAKALAEIGGARVIVTDGPHEVADARPDQRVITALPPQAIPTRVTGAGDLFLAVHLAAELQGATRDAALRRAAETASAFVAGKDLP